MTMQEAAHTMPRAAAEELARLLRALADPTRLRLLALIDAAPDGQATVGGLTAQFDMTQPAISHHLKVLAEAAIVLREKRGSWVWCRLNPQQLAPISHLIPGPDFLRSAHDAVPLTDRSSKVLDRANPNRLERETPQVRLTDGPPQ